MLRDDQYPALLLNADFRPLTMAPISTLTWRESVSAVFDDSVIVVDEHDAWARSARSAIRLPSVLALKSQVNISRPAALTRHNLFVFYRFRCAFCGGRFHSRDLTFEHILPRARGGVSSWQNLVPACVPCNSAKGCRLPHEAGMPLLVEPRHPTVAEINARAAECVSLEAVPKNWLDYIYWGQPLEA
jgi:5-methylcytosine-specific restriction endonuclease McrA